ncbi:hypothetical protein Tco_0280536 [Tanacetum coccineum]
MNDLEEEYQARALLSKSKRFFKKGTQRFNGAKATDQTECHKCGKKGDSKYNKVKAKLALLSSSASPPKSSLDKNKGLIAETYEWDEEEVSSDENEVIEVKALMALANEEEFLLAKKVPVMVNGSRSLYKSSGPKDPVFVKSFTDNLKVSITGSNKPKLSKAEDSTLSNHNTGKWMNLQSIAPPSSLEKLNGVEPVSGPKTIKSILKSKSIFKAETLKGESSSRSRPSRLAIPFPPCIHCGYNDHKSDDCVYYLICEICGSYNHDNHDHNMIISLRRRIKPRIPQYVTKNCETCGSNVHTTSYHNDIEWFREIEALQDKKVESFKARKTESSNALRSKTPTKKYLKGSPSLGLRYPNCSSLDLKGYSNSDYAGCNMDRKSTSGEACNVATAGCCANILWMKIQLTDYVIIYEKVPIFCDNTSAITILNNPFLHLGTKHIDIRYHFIRDHILKGDIELHFIPIQYQLADIFAKPLDEPTFKRLIIEIGMLTIDSKPKASVLPEKTEALALLSKTEQPFMLKCQFSSYS